MLAKGHNMTYSKFRVGGSAVQVLKNKYISTIQALVVTQDCEKSAKTNFYFCGEVLDEKTTPSLTIGFQAIFVNPKTGEIEANADFRKQGEVDGF